MLIGQFAAAEPAINPQSVSDVPHETRPTDEKCLFRISWHWSCSPATCQVIPRIQAPKATMWHPNFTMGHPNFTMGHPNFTMGHPNFTMDAVVAKRLLLLLSWHMLTKHFRFPFSGLDTLITSPDQGSIQNQRLQFEPNPWVISLKPHVLPQLCKGRIRRSLH